MEKKGGLRKYKRSSSRLWGKNKYKSQKVREVRNSRSVMVYLNSYILFSFYFIFIYFIWFNFSFSFSFSFIS